MFFSQGFCRDIEEDWLGNKPLQHAWIKAILRNRWSRYKEKAKRRGPETRPEPFVPEDAQPMGSTKVICNSDASFSLCCPWRWLLRNRGGWTSKSWGLGRTPCKHTQGLDKAAPKKIKAGTLDGLKQSPEVVIKVPALDSKDPSGMTEANFHMFLPHLMISSFCDSYPALVESCFAPSKASNFWEQVAEDDPRLWDSPVAWEKANTPHQWQRKRQHAIPLWLMRMEWSFPQIPCFSSALGDAWVAWEKAKTTTQAWNKATSLTIHFVSQPGLKVPQQKRPGQKSFKPLHGAFKACGKATARK